jgi:hypothetical protein
MANRIIAECHASYMRDRLGKDARVIAPYNQPSLFPDEPQPCQPSSDAPKRHRDDS